MTLDFVLTNNNHNHGHSHPDRLMLDSLSGAAPWPPAQEAGFTAQDGTRLFYRCWPPSEAASDTQPRRALVLLHRGHEHSGRVEALVHALGLRDHWAFAWDARGHGHSPGERGHTPSFATLVDDLDGFMRHVQRQHDIASEHTIVVANSVGAVIAATWLHDYAPRVRGVVMAAAAFEIKLYVPLAKLALRLALGFAPDLNVTSYIKPTMLTHSEEEAQAYAEDPLVTRNISARLLIELADTAQRIVRTASSIDTPMLMLLADDDWVVKHQPQQRFFEALSSPLKRLVKLKDCRHAIFYEHAPVRNVALAETVAFVHACEAQPLKPAAHYHTAHISSASAQDFLALKQGDIPLWARAGYAVQRQMLQRLGHWSNGMHIGLNQGFDSGASLDYVYENQARGRTVLGRLIDQQYLNAIGWRGIRLRRWQLQQVLSDCITAFDPSEPVRILDVAAGGGRYVLETAKRFKDRRLDITLRDIDTDNLLQAQALAKTLGIPIHIQEHDAFAQHPPRHGVGDGFDIAIVSGLYELFDDNAQVLHSLQHLMTQLKPDGYLIYTGQPWHPQQTLIAYTLRNHQGQAWHMRPRPQAELDALVHSAGAQKIATRIGLDGIFTVSLAQKSTPDAPNA